MHAWYVGMSKKKLAEGETVMTASPVVDATCGISEGEGDEDMVADATTSEQIGLESQYAAISSRQLESPQGG